MRVTRIIKDYVEKTVATKLPYGEPSIKYNSERKRLFAIHDELNERLRSIAKELIESGNFELPEGFELSVSLCNLISMSDHRSPLYRAAVEHETGICKKRREAVERILVELELGGSKEELERIISEALAITE